MLSKKFQQKFPRCQSLIRKLESVDVMKTWQVFPRGNQPLEIEKFQGISQEMVESFLQLQFRLDSTMLLLKTTQIRWAFEVG